MKWSKENEVGTLYRRNYPDSGYHKIVTKKAKFLGKLMYCVLVAGGAPSHFNYMRLRDRTLEELLDSLMPNHVDFDITFNKPTRINCGLSFGSGEDSGYQNVRLVIEGKWGDDDFHKKVIKVVDEEYPGWFINGYSLP